jgi:very-short-patch-repair endonuclease
MCGSRHLCDDEECQTCFDKSFASHDKSKYWSEENGDVKPRQVFKSVNTKYWFRCHKCSHEFNTRLANITNLNRWCPYCCNPPKQLCENENCQCCYEKSFASHNKSVFWSEKNGDVKPRQVFKSVSTKYWFDCNTCCHQFQSVVSNITSLKQSWCPYCSNPPKQLCEKGNCKSCFEKSFASHEKSNYWSDKNGDVKPRQVFKSVNTKYWFDCDCGHEFESALCGMTGRNYGCPYCCVPHNQLCEKEDCLTCFEKSFASHEKSKYWSDKNDHVKPRQVFTSANTKYWFDCDCGHQFESVVSSITSLKPTWCPYCGNQKICENKDCQTCFEKSFASHEKSNYWSDKNGDVKPRQVFKYSGNKYWFDCNTCCHQFQSALYSISGKNKSWCPICVNKTEKKLYEQLLQSYPNIISQFRADWCKSQITSRILPFDFVLEEQKIIIELDGNQHFVQVGNWKTPEEQFKNDQYKEKCANENGYSIIRMIQEDVWNDAYGWFIELTQNIIKITSEHTIQNIYMGKKNEYKHFN